MPTSAQLWTYYDVWMSAIRKTPYNKRAALRVQCKALIAADNGR